VYTLVAAARSGSQTVLDFSPSADCPSLQYFDVVEKNSQADLAGLRSGDFLLQVSIQEALLSQTDRATRCVSQNLVNCRNKLYNKSATNRSNGVRGLQL